MAVLGMFRFALGSTIRVVAIMTMTDQAAV